MNLDELAAAAQPDDSAPLRVPAWTLGCFRRRSITFFTGVTDEATTVYWLQAHGLTADLRLPAERPRASALGGVDSLAEAPAEVLVALADVEGGLARTGWDDQRGLMSWSGWEAFQLHDKWPEPGRLLRVGDCLTEHAPSGAYVEDWRLQPSADGPLIGLELVEERERDSGVIRHRGGGLLVCGQHAALVRGRPHPLAGAGARLPDRVRSALADRAALRAIFAFEASYATRPQAGATFTVAASTNPLREGAPLFHDDGFSLDRSGRVVLQRTREDGRWIERRFTIDTLAPARSFPSATAASAAAQHWLASEARTLLRG